MENIDRKQLEKSMPLSAVCTSSLLAWSHPPCLSSLVCSLGSDSLVESLLVSLPRQVLFCQAGPQRSGVALWEGNVGEEVSLPLGRKQGAGTGLGKSMDDLSTMQLCHVRQDALDLNSKDEAKQGPQEREKRNFSFYNVFTLLLAKAGRKGMFKML